MGIIDTFKGLPLGAKIVVTILILAVSAYASALIGLIVMGVMGDVVISGQIAVPAETNATVVATLSEFNTLVGVILSPFTTIAALVIVAVLIAIFFRGKMPGSSGGGGVA